MKRLHVHVRVDDLSKSIAFYSAMFNVEPTVEKEDYAKWMLEDPRVNFAVSQATSTAGIDHLGIQVESDDELRQMHERLERAEGDTVAQMNANCCYARSDKYWSRDPQGIAWETFHSLDSIPVFGGDLQPGLHGTAPGGACCTPTVESPDSVDVKTQSGSCC